MKQKAKNRSTSLRRRLVVVGMLWCFSVLSLSVLGLHTLYKKYQHEVYYARLIDNLKLLRKFHNSTPMERPNDVQLARTVFSGYLDDGQYSKPYSDSFWQIRGSDGTFIASKSLFDCELAQQIVILCSGASQLVRSPTPNIVGNGLLYPGFSYNIYSIAGPLNQKLRVIVSDFVPHQYLSEQYQYSVAGRYVGLESIGRDFILVIGSAFIALIAGTIVAVYWGAAFGLKPLRDLRVSLAKIRAGQATHLYGDFPLEVKPLVEEFHEVIRDRNRIEVENLAHRLKTPLSVLRNQPLSDTVVLRNVVQRQTVAIEQAIEHYLERARRPMTDGILSTQVNIKKVLEHVLSSEEESASGRGIRLHVDSPNSVKVRGDESDITEMLRELVDNGTKWATSEVAIAVVVNGESVVINIEDDGPGVAKEHRKTVLDRGVYLDPDLSETGIGLAKAKEIAAQCGGSIILKDSRLGGLRVAVTLPG